MLQILQGDCLQVLRGLPSESIDACVTDPPYEIGFMGKEWDKSGIAFDPRLWAQVWRVLKPGAHLLSFGGTRTYHRIVCAIEDAGFEIRDQIGWVFGSGFPKSLDVSKAIDKAKGRRRKVVGKVSTNTGMQGRNIVGGSGRGEVDITEPASEEAKQWDGWGTALKPAWEPIVVARKPLSGSVVGNVLRHGTGAINIDACRVELPHDDGLQKGTDREYARLDTGTTDTTWRFKRVARPAGLGRWPANLIHDGSEEVMELFASFGSDKGAAAPVRGTEPTANGFSGPVAYSGMLARVNGEHTFRGDTGTAARFFYCAKARGEDRKGNDHPTVKPTALMRYLCRLVTPPEGTIIDPFAGSGSTGLAARAEGFACILIERDPKHIAIINQRLGL